MIRKIIHKNEQKNRLESTAKHGHEPSSVLYTTILSNPTGHDYSSVWRMVFECRAD